MRTLKGYAEDALKHSKEYCKFNNLDEIERAYEQGKQDAYSAIIEYSTYKNLRRKGILNE